jgi:hypothetical protein
LGEPRSPKLAHYYLLEKKTEAGLPRLPKPHDGSESNLDVKKSPQLRWIHLERAG